MAAAPLCLVAAGALAECEARGIDSAAIAAVTDRLELRLDDGRLIRLVGLAPSPPDFAARPAGKAARAQAEAEWVGRPVAVAALGPADRWGRVPALLAPVEGGADLATWLLARGAGVVGDAREAEPGGPHCPAARRDAERAAREAGAGLWSDAYYAILRAQDRAGLIARAGTFALVEGTVRRVGTGRLRLYLDFAGPDGFSVTATTRTNRGFEAAGMNLRALVGRRLRVRGVLDLYSGRFGAAPRMEIAGPGALELLDGAQP